MQKINTLTNTISSIAMLALAALPMAALTTAAHAAPASVKVADLNLASHEGVTTFNERADYAARKFCNTETSLSARANCRIGVKAELNEKMDAIRSAQAAHASTTFAAR
jgi:UrcA family protein